MPLTIRPAVLEDAPAILAVYAPLVRETAVSFEAEPPELAEIERRIAKTLEHYPWLAAVEGEDLVGYAYAARHRDRAAYRWSVDVSVYVRLDRHRRGIGGALYRPLLEILRRQGFVNAYAGITLPNPGSVGLHESLGFEPVGVYRRVGFKFGRWHDVGWWALPLGDYSNAPAEPVPFPDLLRTPAVEAALRAGS